MQEAKRTALVLGATGGIGGELARTLRSARLAGAGDAPRRDQAGRDGLEWRRGDAMDAAGRGRGGARASS